MAADQKSAVRVVHGGGGLLCQPCAMGRASPKREFPLSEVGVRAGFGFSKPLLTGGKNKKTDWLGWKGPGCETALVGLGMQS
jgi:hypothetical protein